MTLRPKRARSVLQRSDLASYDPDPGHAHRRARPLLPRPHAAGRLAGAQCEPPARGRTDRRHDPRGFRARHLGAHLSGLFPVPAGPAIRQRRAARAAARASGSHPRLRHGQPQLHRPRLGRNRPLPRRGHDRHQARREPAGERSSARSDLRARARGRAPGAAPRGAAPPARLAGAGGLGRPRGVRARRAPSGRALHPRAHRGGRGLAALARRAAGGSHRQRAPRSLGQWRGWRHARELCRSGGRRAAALGLGPHDGHGLGEAALSHAPAARTGARAGQVEERGAHLPARRVPVRLMRVDVNTLLGAYPWRRVPGTSPEALCAAMDRTGIDEAWGSHLPSFFWRAPGEGNAWLYEATGRDRRLKPIPAVHPGRKGWEETIGEAADRGAPAVRCDPTYYGLDPMGDEMRVLAAACGAARLPLLVAVRLEDARQRHPHDRAPELPAAAVRGLLRSDEDVRLIVTHADRAFIEEVHFGSTPEEAARVWWDISWIWGPPEDHLETLLQTVGVQRFVFGTGQPLRLPEASVAKLDLLELTPEQRAAIEARNVLDRLPRPLGTA